MPVSRYSYPPNPKQTEFFGDVIDLANNAFPLDTTQPEILGATDDVVIAEDMGKLLTKDEVVLVCLEDEQRQLQGFSLAMPIDTFDPNRTILRDVSDESVYDEVAYVYYSAIQQELRGQGLVGSLNAALHDRLIDQKYRYMIGDLVINNGFAAKAKKAYGRSVIHSLVHPGYPGIGPQMRLLVDLTNPTNLPGYRPGLDPDPFYDKSARKPII